MSDNKFFGRPEEFAVLPLISILPEENVQLDRLANFTPALFARFERIKTQIDELRSSNSKDNARVQALVYELDMLKVVLNWLEVGDYDDQ